MADHRRLKSIGARYDIDVSRHPDPWRQLRSRLTWIFGVGTILACIPWVLGNHRAFESECVSDAHRPFGQNCQECHDRRMVPLTRMITFNNSIHSTSDKACQKCHRESNSDHLSPEHSGVDRFAALEKQLKSTFDDIGCAGCHSEHRGKAELAQVANSSCTSCHTSVDAAISPRKFELAFHDFANHPEFAIWRGADGKQADLHVPSDPVDHPKIDQHAVPSHSKQTTRVPKVGQIDGETTDETAIKFNHHQHLDPGLLSPGNKPIALNCDDCHQASASGDYFQPINFEQHCHRCHRLGVPASGDLPHARPEIVRGILLDRLAKNEIKAGPSPQDSLGGPTKRPVDVSTSMAELETLLKDQLANLEEQLFVSSSHPPEINPPVSLLEAACTKCHFTEKSSDPRQEWKVVSPDIPNQWMIHSHFRHDRHASVDCTICHTRNGHKFETVDRKLFYPILSQDLKNTSSSIYASTSARDLLLPRMQVCVSCHGNQTNTQASVTDKCVDCHSYHHVPSSTPMPPGIRDLLGTAISGGRQVKSSDSRPESSR